MGKISIRVDEFYLEANKKEKLLFFKLFGVDNKNYGKDFHSSPFKEITSDIFEFIDFIEILKAFSNKKLEKNKEYKFKNFKASLKQKQGISYVYIVIRKDEFYFDKFKATTTSVKLQKLLARLEVWPEQEA